MTVNTEKTNQFIPLYSGRHSIAKAVFTFNMIEPIHDLEKIRLDLKLAIDDLAFDAQIFQQSVIFQIGKSDQQSSTTITGFRLSNSENLADANTTISLQNTLGHGQIQYETTDYRGWQSIKAKIGLILDIIAISMVGSLSQMVFSYQDVFNWVGEPDKFDLSDLLKLDSGIIPVAFITDGFSLNLTRNAEAAPDTYFTELISVNRFSEIGVRIEHVIAANLEPEVPLLEAKNTPFSIILDLLHGQNKQLLNQILTQPNLTAIQLI